MQSWSCLRAEAPAVSGTHTDMHTRKHTKTDTHLHTCALTDTQVNTTQVHAGWLSPQAVQGHGHQGRCRGCERCPHTVSCLTGQAIEVKRVLAPALGVGGAGARGVHQAAGRPHVWASESSSRPPFPSRYLARSFRVTSPTTWLKLSTTTRCRRPSARNSLNTRGRDASWGTV